MLPGVSGGQGNSVQGGDAGPATSGNAETGSQYGGAISFNFEAPGKLLGSSRGGANIGLVVVLVVAIAAGAYVVTRRRGG